MKPRPKRPMSAHEIKAKLKKMEKVISHLSRNEVLCLLSDKQRDVLIQAIGLYHVFKENFKNPAFNLLVNEKSNQYFLSEFLGFEDLLEDAKKILSKP